MRKAAAIQFRWLDDRKQAWQQLADHLHKDPGVLLRDLAEDFLACFSSDQELLRLGMVGHFGRRTGGLIALALRAALQQKALPASTNLAEEPAHAQHRAKTRPRKRAG